MMLTCANCGNEEPEGSRFCGACGKLFVEPESEPAVDEASAEAPTEVAPSPGWPEPPVSEPAPAQPVVPPPPAGRRGGVGPRVLIPALVLLVIGGAAGALFATGMIGGSSGTSDSAFAREVNEKVLAPLGEADRTATESASSTGDAAAVAGDGARIVRVADGASRYLQGLSRLSTKQEAEVQLLLNFVEANRRYGQALASFSPGDDQSQLALTQAATVMGDALTTAQSGLHGSLQLPSQAAFSPQTSPPPPSSTTTSASPASIYFYSNITEPINGTAANNPLLVRPSELGLTNDGSWVLTKLRWSGWGSSVARATGVSSASDCTPSCAGGKRTTSRAQFTLSSPGRLLGHEVYRCFQLTVPSSPKSNEHECLRREGSLILYLSRGKTGRPPSSGGGISRLRSCGGGVSANRYTSCPFAQAVYQTVGVDNGSDPGSYAVHSTVTRRSYTMTCDFERARIVCRGGNNALVSWPR